MSILPKELEEIVHKYLTKLKMNDVMAELKTHVHNCACCEEQIVITEGCDSCNAPICLDCYDYYGGICDNCQYEEYMDSRFDRD